MLKHTRIIILLALIISAFGCNQKSSDRNAKQTGAVGDFSAPLRISATGADAAADE